MGTDDWDVYQGIRFEERPSTDLGYSVRFVLIGPDQAERLLELNYGRNRRLKTAPRKLYRHEMANGQWHPEVSTPLTISDEGHVLDGQHRLQAIIDSGTEQLVEIHEGVGEDMYPYFDNVSKRSAADGLNCANATTVAAGVRQALKIGRHGLTASSLVWTPSADSISNEDIVTYVEAFGLKYGRDAIESAVSFTKRCSKKTTEKPETYGGVGAANTAAAMAAVIVSPKLFEEFSDRVFDRNYSSNRAINSFRFYTVPSQKNGKQATSETARLCGWNLFAHAWNSICGDGPATTFKFFPGRVEEIYGFDAPMFDLGI